MDGIFSLPFVLGMAAYRKEVTPRQWGDGSILQDPKILSFAEKVEPLVDYDLLESEGTTATEVKAKDGKVYRKSVIYDHLWTEEEIDNKFYSANECCGTLLQKDKATELLGLLRRLDTIPKVGEVTDIFAIRR